jgi:hypothetical protein
VEAAAQETVLRSDGAGGPTAYRTPLARVARVLEIVIPAYMFGKAWGIASEKTVELFRVTFPAFLIDAAELLKRLLHTESAHLQRLVATVAGAAVGFGVIALLALVMHHLLRDRRYVDSLRFTAVTLIPIAVLNGTLSHGLGTLVERFNVRSAEALTRTAVHSPWGTFALTVAFFFTALWMMSARTGVSRGRRWLVIGAGAAFVGLYLTCGLMITPREWSDVLPVLQQTLAGAATP